MRGATNVSAGLALALGALACSEPVPGDDVDDTRTRELLRVPDHFETPAIPPFNPVTAEKLELGRHLFYERKLSANQTQSCADCHLQSRAFADDKVTPFGSTGDHLVRNSPGIINVAYMSTLTWSNNTFLELEDQLQVPIRADNPIELGVTDGVVDEVLARFDSDTAYASMFAAAFPESPSGVTINKIVFALATFCRSMISGNSPYDRFLAGDRDALTEQQKRGYSLFNGERLECFHCHSGVNLTVSYRDHDSNAGSIQYPFFNNGLYNVNGEGGYPPQDQGLYNLTAKPEHRGLFRPQSLRNVALTPPYMHDGSIATLREVIQHYAAGGRNVTEGPFQGDGRLNPNKSGLVRGFQISDDEIDAVIAFLESLSDDTFVTDPAFAAPDE
ncbi:MAG: MbnH family di-heme enzyme [Kofleriaceae bacterium]